MKKLLPLIGVWLFSLGFLWATDPFPVGYDVIFHVRYLQDFSEALSQKLTLPDWDARPYGGRGCAAFRFYAPAAYLLGALFMQLGLSVTAALKAVLATYAGIGILGMWLWLRRLGLANQAYLGTWLFAGSPLFAAHLFQMFFFQNICANLLLPVVFLGWQMGRTSPRGLILAGLGLSGMGYTHLPATLMAGYLLTMIALTEGLNERSLSPLWRLAGVGAFAGCLISPYALPAMNGIAEISFYRLETMVPWVRNDFLNDPLNGSAGELWDAIRGVFRVGTVLALIPFGAGFYLGWGRANFWKELLPYGVAAAWGVFMTLRWSMPLWYILPGLKTLQFPWRFCWPAFIVMIPLQCLLSPGPTPAPRKKVLMVLGVMGLVGLLTLSLAIQWFRKPLTEMEVISSIPFYYPPEYLPETCREPDPPPRAGRVREILLAPSDGRIAAERHQFETSEVEGEVFRDQVMLEIKTHWDPCWYGIVNGKEMVPVCIRRCGIMAFPLEKGPFSLRLARRAPYERGWGILLALIVPPLLAWWWWRRRIPGTA